MILRYRAHLEAELLRQEQLLKSVITEKERTIAWLEEELARIRAKCDRMELVLMPLASRAGAAYAAVGNKEQIKTSTQPKAEGAWLNYLKNYMKEQEQLEREAQEKTNGVHVEGRKGLHEQTNGSQARHNDGDAKSQPPK